MPPRNLDHGLRTCEALPPASRPPAVPPPLKSPQQPLTCDPRANSPRPQPIDQAGPDMGARAGLSHRPLRLVMLLLAVGGCDQNTLPTNAPLANPDFSMAGGNTSDNFVARAMVRLGERAFN